jgi:hypothetical protein
LDWNSVPRGLLRASSVAEPADPRSSPYARWQGGYDRALFHGLTASPTFRESGRLQRSPGAGLYGLGESPNSKYFRDILADFKPGEEPLQPAAAEILRQHAQAGGVASPGLNCLPDGVPHADLLPEPFKIIQTPGEILFLYEVETTFRQIFTDGRKQLTDPSPTWMGYSVGQWEGDTLVVDTLGFNDRSWLDARGHGHSEDMRVQERFHRRDFGHLEVTATITGPKTLTRPITINFVDGLLPDTDLLEHYCLENEKEAGHETGRAAR